MTKLLRRTLIATGVLGISLLGVVSCQLPQAGAAAVLHPLRLPVMASPPDGCREVTFKGEGIELKGWRGDTIGKRRGTVIYLHGIADNRTSGTGVLERFRKRGFDVIAYDSRAHGHSGGEACTYGYYEKTDLKRVLDTLPPGPVVLIGSSLGGAVALQLAATDKRVSTIVAAETFSDLRTVATERAPFFFNKKTTDEALRIAGEKGRFPVDDASPVIGARTITAPVLLIHGASDTDTPPAHSRRLLAALPGTKELILVPDAKHNGSLSQGEIWTRIEIWIDTILPPPPGGEGR